MVPLWCELRYVYGLYQFLLISLITNLTIISQLLRGSEPCFLFILFYHCSIYCKLSGHQSWVFEQHVLVALMLVSFNGNLQNIIWIYISVCATTYANYPPLWHQWSLYPSLGNRHVKWSSFKLTITSMLWMTNGTLLIATFQIVEVFTLYKHVHVYW